MCDGLTILNLGLAPALDDPEQEEADMETFSLNFTPISFQPTAQRIFVLALLFNSCNLSVCQLRAIQTGMIVKNKKKLQ